MVSDDFYDPDVEPVDLLMDVVDSDELQFEIPEGDETDPHTAAVMRVLHLIDQAHVDGEKDRPIPCPFCGKPLRYRKDEKGRFAECPGNDFVAMG